MKPFDYVVAAVAYIYAFETEDGIQFPRNLALVADHFISRYGKTPDASVISSAVDELARLGFFKLIRDQYAGDIVQFDQKRFDERYSSMASRSYRKFISPADGAADFYSKSMNNPQLWSDLSGAQDSSSDDIAPPDIPASDRIVTLAHNSEEARAIAMSVDAVIDGLETNNEVAANAGPDRERLLAEAKASRELIKGESISFDKLKSLVLKFFQEVQQKFAEKAAEWSLEKTISILLKILELLK